MLEYLYLNPNMTLWSERDLIESWRVAGTPDDGEEIWLEPVFGAQLKPRYRRLFLAWWQ
jgi:hypothetical protein